MQNQTVKRMLVVFDGLSEASQISALKFAEFLATSESEEDIRFYDEAKANDDGYRISASDLRKKYGI